MAWFLNRYHCAACATSWEDEWSCGCDDECPGCGDDLSPEDSEDLTVILEGCEVGVSPASAEDDADYDWRTFASPEKAEKFAARVRRLMDAGKLRPDVTRLVADRARALAASPAICDRLAAALREDRLTGSGFSFALANRASAGTLQALRSGLSVPGVLQELLEPAEVAPAFPADDEA